MLENYYDISTFSNLAGGFIYGSLLSLPIYLTVGILVSYLIIRITNKVDPNKPYFFGLLMYSLLGFITVAVLLYIFRFGIFDFSDTIFFLVSILDYGTTSNYNTRKIYSDFTWNSSPYWKLVDKMGIAWADGWNIKSGSDAIVYQYYGEITGKLFTEYYYDGQYTAEAGVDFENLDLKNVTPDGSEHTKNHSGWAKIEIGRYINQTPYNDTERTDVLTKYFHKFNSLTASGSVSVTGGPDISITNQIGFKI